MNLQRLAENDTVADALASARRLPIVPVMPELVERLKDGRRVRIPAEAGYGVSEVTVSNPGVVKQTD